MNRSFLSLLISLVPLLPGSLSAEIVDTLSFGNDASESLHELSATYSDFTSGGLGEPARRLSSTDYPVGSRPKIDCDASGNLYAVYLSHNTTADVVAGGLPGKLVVASASKASQYADWEAVQTLDTLFYGEALLDQDRLLTDNVLSVYVQEISEKKDAVGTPLHVVDFSIGTKRDQSNN